MIVSIHFDTVAQKDDRLDRMAEVYRRTLEKNCRMPFHVKKIDACRHHNRDHVANANHHKLRYWADLAGAFPCVLTDVDMLCLRDPSTVFDQVEHIGVTYRDQETDMQMPINGGVVVVKSAIGAMILRTWYEYDCRLYHDMTEHHKLRPKWGGMNQCSFGLMLEERPEFKSCITQLPCSVWNNVEPWDGWRDAYFVHLKGASQRVLFDGAKCVNEDLNALVEFWSATRTGGQHPGTPAGSDH